MRFSRSRLSDVLHCKAFPFDLWGTSVLKRFADLPHTPFAVTDVISAMKEFGRFVSNMTATGLTS
jgi:hypothetical protein